MITIDRLTLSYGRQQVLKDCSLRVETGSRVALMGPSGCGKTSLINVLAGVLSPDSGKVSGNGKGS